MKNKEISIDTFSVLNTAGWLLMILRLSGCINLSWLAIANYWFSLAAIALILGIVAAIIGIWTHKAGDNSVK